MSPVAPQPLSPATAIGAVRLAVADLEGVRRFYEEALGLRVVARGDDGAVSLGAADGRALVELLDRPGAAPAPRPSTGLFHLALLVPGRAELAGALRRLLDHGSRLSGASDHLVSEALYLRDPEGNGIEIYRDRPRGEWPRGPEGIRMDTLPLDLRHLLADLPSEPDGAIAEDTRMGHVHLHVANLDAAEAFYGGVLGFEVTVRTYAGALFLSAGGYHHHLGLNVWAGEGAPAPPRGVRGLDRFEVLVGVEELDAVAGRLDRGGRPGEHAPGELLVVDPSGNRVFLRAEARHA